MGIYNSKWKLNTRHHRNLFNFIKFAFKGLKVITRWHAQGRVSHIDVVFMELQQLPKEPQVHEHPAWPASIRLWQLSWKTYRLIRPPIVTISIVMVNWGWKQSNFIRTWVGFELTFFRSWSNDATTAPRLA